MTHENGNWMNADQRDAMKSDCKFPIMGDPINSKRGYIPMGMVRQHRDQALINHMQTPERLRERGGLSPSEALAVLNDRAWHRPINEDAAWEELRYIVECTHPDFDVTTGELTT